MVNVIKTFECSYCHETFKTIEEAERHEINCYYNTSKRQCSTCKHCTISYGSHEYSSVVTRYYCKLEVKHYDGYKRNCDEYENR
jgi:hypothetical protein